LRIARELKIFLGNVGGVASNFHVRSVGLVHAGQWILLVMMVVAAAAFTAVATTHALIILTVSHDLLFHQPLFARRIAQLTKLGEIRKSYDTTASRRLP
jgi:hypothetical protein